MDAPIRETQPKGRRYRLRETVRSTHSPDGAIVLEIDKGSVFQLNLTGSMILEFLKSKPECLEAELAAELSREFNISPESAAADVAMFAQLLADHKLIEPITS
jgi:hypothetical protein